MGWTGRVLKLLLAVVVASAFTVLLSFLIPFLVDAPRGMVIPDQVMDRTNQCCDMWRLTRRATITTR
jgi:hypothetical protein